MPMFGKRRKKNGSKKEKKKSTKVKMDGEANESSKNIFRNSKIILGNSFGVPV